MLAVETVKRASHQSINTARNLANATHSAAYPAVKEINDERSHGLANVPLPAIGGVPSGMPPGKEEL